MSYSACLMGSSATGAGTDGCSSIAAGAQTQPLTAYRCVHYPHARPADELKRKAAARELEIDSQWKDRLEEASRRFANERELLSNSWSSRLAAAQEEAAARYRALQVRNLQRNMYLSCPLQDTARAPGLARVVKDNRLPLCRATCAIYMYVAWCCRAAGSRL